jgi:ABC-type spermidine/putrescine transport system permease subunit I
MAHLRVALVPGLLGAAGNAALDWVYGTAASVVFVLLIAVPAAALNSRERRRRQQQQPAP